MSSTQYSVIIALGDDALQLPEGDKIPCQHSKLKKINFMFLFKRQKKS